MKLSWGSWAAALIASSQAVNAISVDLDSETSVKSAAKQLAYDTMVYYTGNNTGDTPGNLPSPYYWWECGALFGAMIDYWYYTGDSTYNDEVIEGMLHQAGTNEDFMPQNQTKTEGNDDQGFWALAAMSAAEANFPNPATGKAQWLALAQAVFNTQAPRWDTSTCGGGLRWQIFTWNNGYTYKNSISQGCFFNLAARLAKYTGNQTYAQWAEKTWDWMDSVQLMDDNYKIYDGTDDTKNCTSVNHVQWTYNAGVMLLGAASMYNMTSSDKWKARVEGLLNSTDVFFQNGVMYEVACETNNLCNTDQHSFKAFLSRWMAATTKLAPFTYDTIMAKLKTSAAAAAKQCSGGTNGRTCGFKWTQEGQWDGSYGVGQEMAALEVILSQLIKQTKAPVTNSTGGTSVGNNNAGGSDTGATTPTIATHKVTTGDKVGAGFITTVLLLGVIGGTCWMIV